MAWHNCVVPVDRQRLNQLDLASAPSIQELGPNPQVVLHRGWCFRQSPSIERYSGSEPDIPAPYKDHNPHRRVGIQNIVDSILSLAYW